MDLRRRDTSAFRAWRLLIPLLGLAFAGCSGRPEGNLIEVHAAEPVGAAQVDVPVATTRAPVADPPGVMFGGGRAIGLNYADIVVSIPPDGARKVGEVQWPSSLPGDPAKDFVTVSARPLAETEIKAEFDKRVAAAPHRRVLIFVHGYNTRFEEAVYRFAQVAHDADAQVVPVLFTWPSRGQALAYFYDRESANYSRDALEGVLQTIVKDPNVGEVSILAHSLGNFVAVEAVRQMVIRNHGLSPKVKNIMLAAPDIDIDVFRRQLAEIEHYGKAAPITLFVSTDDRALSISRLVAGDEPRVGATDPLSQPFKGILDRAKVNVVDLTKFASDDPANHSKFASQDVVGLIGSRLAAGQTLTDARSNLGETLGAIAVNGAGIVGKTAATVVSAPFDGLPEAEPQPAEGEAKPLTP